MTEEYDESSQVLGDDYWRYGIEASRKEPESVMRYACEQGLVKRHLEFEPLFHPSTLES